MWERVKKFFATSKKPTYWLTRYIILRVLGFVYFIAFLSLATQVIPLIGNNGLLPADIFLDRVESSYDSKFDAFKRLPTLFLINVSDTWLLFFAWFGVVLSLLVTFRYANSVMLAVLWFLYMSYDHVGQLWYGYGWEIQLLETGFLAIFLVPFWDWKPFPKKAPPTLIIWLYRWLTFRIYLGAGLIKIRGGQCWRDLTCMNYHYETQPIPNPLSPFLHYMPNWYHKFGVLYNHFIELIVPFFVFWPRFLRLISGVLLLTFQIYLIASGNLSFLNWVTIIPGLALFDDGFLKKFLPKKLVKKAEKAMKKQSKKKNMVFYIVLFMMILTLSIPVVQNLSSSGQAMNRSFNQWHFVNTYGAFGSVGSVRNELVVQGTSDNVIHENTIWKEYEFKAKPTDVNRALPIIAPYQPRIDWQIWFAAMSIPDRQPWLLHFVWKLLHNDQGAISLIAHNPFPDDPPMFIRIQYYRYEFEKPLAKTVWKRSYLGPWLPPLSKNNEGFRNFIEANGWNTYD